MTARLTPSERTVLVLLANGRTPTSIATEQHLQPGTIHAHAANARRKLGVQTTTHAVAAALALGIIRPAEIVIDPMGRAA